MGRRRYQGRRFKGDPCRTNQAVVFGMPSSDEENLAFDMANFHKRFVALNLKSEKGLEVMMKLLSEADVFITNTRTKSLEQDGPDWESLHEKFPRLIMGHGIGYGKKGDEKDAAGFDVTCYMGRGGVFGTTVNKGDAPIIPPTATAISSARSSLLRVSSPPLSAVSKAALATTSPARCSTQASTRFPRVWFPPSTATPIPRAASRSTTPSTTSSIPKTTSGLFCACPNTNRDWPRVMHLIGRDDLAEHPDYSVCQTVNDKGLAPEVVKILDEGFAQFTREELLEDVLRKRHALRARADSARHLRR